MLHEDLVRRAAGRAVANLAGQGRGGAPAASSLAGNGGSSLIPLSPSLPYLPPLSHAQFLHARSADGSMPQFLPVRPVSSCARFSRDMASARGALAMLGRLTN